MKRVFLLLILICWAASISYSQQTNAEKIKQTENHKTNKTVMKKKRFHIYYRRRANTINCLQCH